MKSFAEKHGFRPRGARVHRYQECACGDPGCDKGHGSKCPSKGVVAVYRCDYTPDGSQEKFLMCHKCAEDARKSGLFSLRRPSWG